MRNVMRGFVPVLLVSSVLSGCVSTSSDGSAPLNQRNWPICSVVGGLAGGGLGAIESSAWAGGGAALGALAGGLICFAHDGDEDGDGVFDRRDRCKGTPPNTPVSMANGCPLPVYPAKAPVAEAPVAPPQEQVITLSEAENVLFAFDSSVLTAEFQTELGALVADLKKADIKGIKVVGHTDSVGTDGYNQKLSERRAASVVTFLTREGVSAGLLTSEGLGESQPVADNATAEGRAQNRRVELHLTR
jgi:OOP family OmpA-OmpF porin